MKYFDLIGKSMSAIATIWGIYSVGAYINQDDYTVMQGVGFAVGGALFSLVWTFYLMGSFTASLNKGALLRYGVVPALMWILNAPAVYDTYMTVIVDRDYKVAKHNYISSIEPINKKLSMYSKKLDNLEDNELSNKQDVEVKKKEFIDSHKSFVSALDGYYTPLRSEYKKMNYEDKMNSEYYKAYKKCENKGYSIPSNSTAPSAIAECKWLI